MWRDTASHYTLHSLPHTYHCLTVRTLYTLPHCLTLSHTLHIVSHYTHCLTLRIYTLSTYYTHRLTLYTLSHTTHTTHYTHCLTLYTLSHTTLTASLPHTIHTTHYTHCPTLHSLPHTIVHSKYHGRLSFILHSATLTIITWPLKVVELMPLID